MVMTIEAWLLNVNGRKIDRDGGFPAKDPYQCWDLWADYAERVEGVPLAATFTNYGGSSPHPGYACNVFHNASRVSAITSRFTIVGPGAVAQPGDVAFWEKGGIYAGSHVAIVTADRGKTLRCMSQNKGPGHDAAAYETLSKSTLLGYLRPRSKATAPVTPDKPGASEEDDDMPFTDEDRALLRAIRDDQKQREDGVEKSRAELTLRAARAAEKFARASRDGDITPGGWTYQQQMLPLLQTVVALLGERQATSGAEVNVDELAEAIAGALGDDLAQQFVDALGKRIAG